LRGATASSRSKIDQKDNIGAKYIASHPRVTNPKESYNRKPRKPKKNGEQKRKKYV